MHATHSANLDDPTARLGSPAFRGVMRTYGAALLAIGMAILVRYSLSPWIGAVLPFVTVPGAVAGAAWLGGYRPAALVAMLGYALSAWLLVPGQGVPTDAIELGGWVGLAAYSLTCVLVVAFVEMTRRGQAADRDAARVLRAALRNVSEAVVTADARGCVTSMNAVAERLTGWREHDAIGQSIDIVVRLVDAESRAPLGTPGVLGFDPDNIVMGVAERTILVSRQGSEHDVDERTVPLRDALGSQTGIVMLLADTTESRHEERERQAMLRELRRRASIVDTATDPIIVTAMDGTIVTWNAAATRLFGHADAVGKHVSLIVARQRLAEEAAILGAVLAGCRTEPYDTECLRADGRRLIVSLSVSPIRNERGEVTGASLIARDVTSQRHAEQRDRALLAQAIAERKSLEDDLQRVAQELLQHVRHSRVR
jgi:PAS domain S-box-containing protein